MSAKQVFEYATIRVVPRVAREEFVNVGVIVFSKSAKFLECHIELDVQKVLMLDAEADIEEIQAHLQAFQKIAYAQASESNICALDLGERFRWLTAVRSTMVQCSKVHVGLSKDLELSTRRLLTQMVL